MNEVAIVDFGLCNLDSIVRAVEQCGGHTKVVSDYEAMQEVSHIILPGVGTFRDAMCNLRERGLDQALNERVIRERIPFLGICLGMQLIANRGSEEGNQNGLGWIKGEVVKLQQKLFDDRTIHIGWNEVHYFEKSKLFSGIDDKTDFYFMHGYHFVCKDTKEVIATTPYCGNFVSAVRKGHIYGVQFHPEKSQKAGFQILRNFLAI